MFAFRVDLETGATEEIGAARTARTSVAWTPDHSRVVLGDGYTMGDIVLYETAPTERAGCCYGTPIDEREEGVEYPLNGLGPRTAGAGGNPPHDDGLRRRGHAWLPRARRTGEIEPVAIEGLVHEGEGELEGLRHLEGGRYAPKYNIDGCSWVYETCFDEAARKLAVERVLVGEGDSRAECCTGWTTTREAAASRSPSAPPPTRPSCTCSTPATRSGAEDARARARPRPRLLSAGEDASFESHDGLRVSARLYRPSPELGYEGPRPLVYYVHGGPQGQERPNFAWFSMPLIQILTLEGFAVFVPNARGSTGYGLDYTKRVDKDWGGQDGSTTSTR